MGKDQHVFLRDVGHVCLAAMAGLQAEERDENIIVGKLDLGEKFLLWVDDSGNFHDSSVYLARIRTFCIEPYHYPQ